MQCNMYDTVGSCLLLGHPAISRAMPRERLLGRGAFHVFYFVSFNYGAFRVGNRSRFVHG